MAKLRIALEGLLVVGLVIAGLGWFLSSHPGTRLPGSDATPRIESCTVDGQGNLTLTIYHGVGDKLSLGADLPDRDVIVWSGQAGQRMARTSPSEADEHLPGGHPHRQSPTRRDAGWQVTELSERHRAAELRGNAARQNRMAAEYLQMRSRYAAFQDVRQLQEPPATTKPAYTPESSACRLVLVLARGSSRAETRVRAGDPGTSWGRHGVDDHFIAALEDQDHRLQQSGTGVKTQTQLPVGWAVLVEWLDPQRPLGRLNRILR